MTESPACPTCGYPSRSIAYGLPSFELFQSADRGEVALGGCVIMPDSPDFACTNPEERHTFSARAARTR